MTNINKNKIIGFATPIALFFAPATAWAQTDLVPSTIRPINNVLVVVRGIINFILLAAFVLAFIMLVVGGARWIFSGGDEKSIEKARNTITASLIGLVIILVAYAIIRIVEIFFGNLAIISGPINVPTFNSL